MFFFFFNIENRIGLKKLSDEDLGKSVKSNQTHIGLYNDVLTFLGNNVVTSAMLIYGNYCQLLDCYFDRIENPDGTFRSPKIRLGGNDSDSIVHKIREFAAQKPNEEWYILWSGLDNKDLVFWLINNKSEDFRFIKDLISSKVKIITGNDIEYENLRNIIVNKINQASLDIQKDIEIVAEVGDISKKYKAFDIEKAKRNLALIGKRGEELVNAHLERELSAQRISSFEWLNKSKESGLPYDFILNDHRANKQYIDVKSTRFDFNQNIVFSSQEANFVNEMPCNESYSVYRIFSMNEADGILRICNNCSAYMTELNKSISVFKQDISRSKTLLLNMNLSVKPADCFMNIQEPIIL